MRRKFENNQTWSLVFVGIMDHLIKKLKTIIALAYVTYIINLDAYELHLGD